MTDFTAARELLKQFKEDAYIHGTGVLSRCGALASQIGSRAAIVRGGFPGSDECVRTIQSSLREAGVECLSVIKGARPNAPYEDVQRIASEIDACKPDLIVSFGAGSTIDATKAAEVTRTLGGDLEKYFGMGLVTSECQASGRQLTPHLAIQTASGSAAHLTKYSNVTNMALGQKKLIIDEAVVPQRALFDYAVTHGAPASLTADGALDGVSHALEVFYGASDKPYYDTAARIAREAIGLVLKYLPEALRSPTDSDAREALGLATDLGGYAIMIGGTNGAHLTSFSLVDLLSHGRACAVLNPYYTVFFAPAIQDQLRTLAELYEQAGFLKEWQTLQGRDLGVAVARAMIAFSRSIQFPATLGEVESFTDAHIDRAIQAAQNPQLESKLKNMPVALKPSQVDEYMRPVLLAAKTGNLDEILNMDA